MRLGVGLPVEVPGTTGETLLQWMRRADAGPFDTVAVVDEIVSHNYEGLVTLAAAAGATRKVRLMSVVISGPTRNTAILAKQAASIDALSGGRLSLGLGVGDLAEDFAAVEADLRGRGNRFDEQLALMKRIWAGEPMGDSGRPIGPSPVQPGGPELLLGGWAPRAMERIGQFADGYVGAVLSEDMLDDEPYRLAEKAWRKHRREGKPRFVQNVYFALGSDAQDALAEYLHRSYSGSSDYDTAAIQAVVSRTESEVREMVERLGSIGADEVIFHTVSSNIEQFERLQHAIG